MRRTATDRRVQSLLPRRPRLEREAVPARPRVVDVVDQYRALVALTDRGLLSRQEFSRQARLIAEDASAQRVGAPEPPPRPRPAS